MKALQITGYGDIAKNVEIIEIAKPSIGEEQVLIEIHAASINPIDYKIIEGAMKNIQQLSFPAPSGFDVAGIIIDIGSRVTDFNIGDEVFSRVPTDAPGSFAEVIAVDHQAVCQKPTKLSFTEAASIPLVGLTTLQAFQTAKLKSGDKVLIHAGSGGVGSFAVQYAKAKGAYVYTTTSTKNTDWVKDLGADRVIDYKTEDYKTIVKDIDIVFDTLGQNYTAEAFGVIKNGGKVVSIVGPLDEESAKMFGMVDYKLPKELSQLISKKNASYKFIMMRPNREHLEAIKKLIENEKIKPIIDEVYPFSKGIEAMEHLATGRAKGKIVIKII
jgi:NADPH:quinone reductase-like Zn-dependent oxidoreductase